MFVVNDLKDEIVFIAYTKTGLLKELEASYRTPLFVLDFDYDACSWTNSTPLKLGNLNAGVTFGNDDDAIYFSLFEVQPCDTPEGVRS